MDKAPVLSCISCIFMVSDPAASDVHTEVCLFGRISLAGLGCLVFKKICGLEKMPVTGLLAATAAPLLNLGGSGSGAIVGGCRSSRVEELVSKDVQLRRCIFPP